jgi:hypothetical protein
MPTKTSAHHIAPHIAQLEREYTWSVNQALGASDISVASELVDAFAAEIGALTGDSGGGESPASRHPVAAGGRRPRRWSARRRSTRSAMGCHVDQVVNPKPHLAPRAHRRGPLSY